MRADGGHATGDDDIGQEGGNQRKPSLQCFLPVRNDDLLQATATGERLRRRLVTVLGPYSFRLQETYLRKPNECVGALVEQNAFDAATRRGSNASTADCFQAIA